jgi:hypothetical protein
MERPRAFSPNSSHLPDLLISLIFPINPIPGAAPFGAVDQAAVISTRSSFRPMNR